MGSRCILVQTAILISCYRRLKEKKCCGLLSVLECLMSLVSSILGDPEEEPLLKLESLQPSVSQPRAVWTFQEPGRSKKFIGSRKVPKKIHDY